jgi:hypothetical protein
MAAELVEEDRLYFNDESFADITIWKVPQPVRGSSHYFKYRLAFVFRDKCVLRYDNEAGKGDHKHIDEQEFPVQFVDLEKLRTDFFKDIKLWRSRR